MSRTSVSDIRKEADPKGQLLYWWVREVQEYNLFGIDRAKGKTSVEIGAFVYASSCVEISRIAFLEIVD